jgi:hypothetical protein
VDWRGTAKRVSVALKIVVGLIGFLGAAAWFASAQATTPISASYWNCWAAAFTAVATAAQAASALIDWRVAPSASWA